MNIDLKINDTEFSIGADIGESELNSGGFEKSGFFTKRMLKTPRGQTLYFSKNCTIKCFNGSFNYYPVFGDNPDDYDYMCGTSCFIFMDGNKIVKIVFQVINGKIQSISAYKEMKDLMRKKYGDPINECSTVESWGDENESFICELSSSKKNSYFHWVTS